MPNKLIQHQHSRLILLDWRKISPVSSCVDLHNSVKTFQTDIVTFITLLYNRQPVLKNAYRRC